MKKIYSIVLVLGLFLIGCTSNTEYTYQLIYVDGTIENVVTRDVLNFTGNADCVSACGCGGGDEIRICGVRKFKLLRKRDLNKKTRRSAHKPIDDF